MSLFYSVTWRNTRDLYTQNARIDEFDLTIPQHRAFILLLEKYGECFDAEWWYYLCNRGRGKGLYVRRCPIWQTVKRMPTEKHRPLPRVRQQRELETCFNEAQAGC